MEGEQNVILGEACERVFEEELTPLGAKDENILDAANGSPTSVAYVVVKDFAKTALFCRTAITTAAWEGSDFAGVPNGVSAHVRDGKGG